MNFIQQCNDVYVGYLGAHKNMVMFTIKPKKEGWILVCKLPGMKKEFGPFEDPEIAKAQAAIKLEDWLRKCSIIDLSRPTS